MPNRKLRLGINSKFMTLYNRTLLRLLCVLGRGRRGAAVSVPAGPVIGTALPGRRFSLGLVALRSLPVRLLFRGRMFLPGGIGARLSASAASLTAGSGQLFAGGFRLAIAF